MFKHTNFTKLYNIAIVQTWYAHIVSSSSNGLNEWKHSEHLKEQIMNENTKHPTEPTNTTLTSNPVTNDTEKKCCTRTEHGRCHGYRCKRLWLVAALLAAGLVGGLVGRGCAHHGGFDRESRHMGQGFEQMHPDFSGMRGEHGMRGGMGAEMITRMGERVNATDEQKTKLAAIAKTLSDGQDARQSAMQATRQKTIELLSASTIDTAAIEQLRAAQVAQMDEQSKRFSQAMMDAAQVLTPEQRAHIAQMMPMRLQN